MQAACSSMVWLEGKDSALKRGGHGMEGVVSVLSSFLDERHE